MCIHIERTEVEPANGAVDAAIKERLEHLRKLVHRSVVGQKRLRREHSRMGVTGTRGIELREGSTKGLRLGGVIRPATCRQRLARVEGRPVLPSSRLDDERRVIHQPNARLQSGVLQLEMSTADDACDERHDVAAIVGKRWPDRFRDILGQEIAEVSLRGQSSVEKVQEPQVPFAGQRDRAEVELGAVEFALELRDALVRESENERVRLPDGLDHLLALEDVLPMESTGGGLMRALPAPSTAFRSGRSWKTIPSVGR